MVRGCLFIGCMLLSPTGHPRLSSGLAAMVLISMAAMSADVSVCRANEVVGQGGGQTRASWNREQERAAEQEIAATSYRLATANASRCADPQPMTGLTLHDIASYDARQRPAIRQVLALGPGFGVRDVVPASPAARSGIRDGDEIVAVGATQVEVFKLGLIGSRATPARVEAFEQVLDRTLRSGPVPYRIHRAGTIVEGTLSGEPGCGGQAVYVPDDLADAWSDGVRVAVTRGIVALAGDEDELAFVIAHEMAHNVLGHARQLAGHSALLAQIGIGSGAYQQSEREADALAATLMAAAGYAPRAAVRLLARLKEKRGGSRALTHPDFDQRIAVLTRITATSTPDAAGKR